MNKTFITQSDGTSRAHYDGSDVDPETHAFLFTGPISGTLALSDGTAYDVSEDVIVVKHEHRDELKKAILKAHHAAGRFLDVPLPE